MSLCKTCAKNPRINNNRSARSVFDIPFMQNYLNHWEIQKRSSDGTCKYDLGLKDNESICFSALSRGKNKLAVMVRESNERNHGAVIRYLFNIYVYDIDYDALKNHRVKLALDGIIRKDDLVKYMRLDFGIDDSMYFRKKVDIWNDNSITNLNYYESMNNTLTLTDTTLKFGGAEEDISGDDITEFMIQWGENMDNNIVSRNNRGDVLVKSSEFEFILNKDTYIYLSDFIENGLYKVSDTYVSNTNHYVVFILRPVDDDYDDDKMFIYNWDREILTQIVIPINGCLKCPCLEDNYLVVYTEEEESCSKVCVWKHNSANDNWEYKYEKQMDCGTECNQLEIVCSSFISILLQDDADHQFIQYWKLGALDQPPITIDITGKMNNIIDDDGEEEEEHECDIEVEKIYWLGKDRILLLHEKSFTILYNAFQNPI